MTMQSVAPVLVAFILGVSPLAGIWLKHRLDEIARVAEATRMLVNSHYTMAKRSELGANVRELARTVELAELREAMGQTPSADLAAAMRVTRATIASLEDELEDRAEQARLAGPAGEHPPA
jgi:uncharacterized protein with von Willebrand factor type A (vWA) domain